MRIGLYGMPCAGKTHILDKLDFIEVVVGSKLLRQYDPNFDIADETTRERDRKEVAKLMMQKKTFIMDGHYAFGDEIAFTEDEGKMYDVYLYLYVDPQIIEKRMNESPKNRKYLKFNISEWQNKEIINLREYCHKNNKDFYVIDNPPTNVFDDVSEIICFIKDIVNGYSCISYAKDCSKKILEQCSSVNDIYLIDGDKTLIKEDSSRTVFGYKTNIFDGNYYTGFQMWKQKREFLNYNIPLPNKIPVHVNEKVSDIIKSSAFILTSGHDNIWEVISSNLNIPFFGGNQMSAETKLFITKELQKHGKNVIAIGDGMNDYYMLKQADQGYLVKKDNGSVSRSLINVELGGFKFV